MVFREEGEMVGISDDAARPADLFVAVELSKTRWVVGVTSLGDAKAHVHRLEAGDGHGLDRLLALIERHRAALARHSGGPVRVVSCYEAGHDGFWLHRALTARAIANQVLDPASLQVDRRARRAKTDRLDAAMLLRALMAWSRGDARACRPVRVPTPEQEDLRRLGRERERLLVEKTAHANRIEGLLMTLGVRGFQPARGDWRERLASLRDPLGGALPERLAREIARECERLHLVLDQFTALTREIEGRMREEAHAHAALQGAGVQINVPARLMRLRGIAAIGADTLGREVFWRDFVNRREVASYVGLAPTPARSGASMREQGISKAGNRRARTLILELAWLWLRYQPDSAITRWFTQRTQGARGRMRRILIVAAARRLVVALWRFLTTGLVPEGARMKA
jgi:transposase